jgi:hypothetical protein
VSGFAPSKPHVSLTYRSRCAVSRAKYVTTQCVYDETKTKAFAEMLVRPLFCSVVRSHRSGVRFTTLKSKTLFGCPSVSTRNALGIVMIGAAVSDVGSALPV